MKFKRIIQNWIFFSDSIQRNIHSIPKKEYLPPLRFTHFFRQLLEAKKQIPPIYPLLECMKMSILATANIVIKLWN